MLDFLSANYVWLIVIGVFILMIIVGYFADKNQNKEKKEKLKDHVDELDKTENETDDVKIDEWEDKPLPKEEDDIIEVKGLDNSFDSWDDNMESDEAKEEVTEDTANSESIVEENDNESPVEEKNDEPLIEKNNEISEEPITLPETEESSSETEVQPEETSEESIPENEKSEESDSSIEDLEITLPNIDTLNEEIKDVVDAEDVWKF